MLRKNMVVLIALTFPGGLTPAFSQSSRQTCLELATIVQGLTPSVADARRSTAGLDWMPIISNTTGDLRGAAQNAGAAKEKLVQAMAAYQSALEDVAYQARRCAR
jgi:hypothetical protein